MSVNLRLPLLILPPLLIGACGGGTGVIDEETGLQGRSIEEGALAGTWAQKTNFATIVPIPVLGDRPGGGSSTRLVHRTWIAAEQRYEESFIRCTNDVQEVEGTKTIVKDETLAKIAPGKYGTTAAHGDGTWTATDIMDLWGVRNLPDPVETPLPTPANFKEPPQSDWVWDEDGDEKPGVTIFMRGTLSADVYVIKRNIYSFEGTILDEDHVQGLIRQGKSESNSLESDVSWLAGEGSSRPDADPLNSWFDMIRLPDDAGCDEVKAAVADGRLAATRPF